MWKCITVKGVFMVSKKELRKQVTDQEIEIKELRRFVGLQTQTIGDLREKARKSQTIFMTANVDGYPTKDAKDEALNHIRERLDTELQRLNIPAHAILLPDTVKDITIHETAW